MDNLSEKFTTNYKEILINSINLALELKSKYLLPEFLVFSILGQKGSLGAEILAKTNLKADLLKQSFKTIGDSNITEQQSVVFSPQTKKILEKSLLTAQQYNHTYIGSEHLLYAALENEQAQKFLLKNKIDLGYLRKQTDIALKSTSKFHDIMGSFHNSDSIPGSDDQMAAFPFPATKNRLENFALDLTDTETQQKIDPIIGRSTEIERLIQILLRRNKNNPLLLGDPGVGKTAIVEGLAKKILNREVPDFLLNKKILSLDMSLIVAGTMFRGEFENRLKQIIEEAKKNPDMILFIDEIHNIIGAGSAHGSMDAANILKPYLARGDIKCIGATTYEEYKKSIENDPALERRFQPINVEEPTEQKTLEILKGVKSNYENFHQIEITQEAIESAVSLSKKYIHNRFLPDKAIDLIDEAAAKLKLHQAENSLSQILNRLNISLNKTKKTKETAILHEDFKAAIDCKRLEKEIQDDIKEIEEQKIKEGHNFIGKITKKEISALISQMTQLPVDDLILEDTSRLLKLEEKLNLKLFGQQESISQVATLIKKSLSGFFSSQRPMASFIFIGPSGVGKTYLAQQLAETLFGDRKAILRLDMSEFKESFNIAKLIGAPAGYVGYKEANKLTDFVKKQPFSLILFDEIEKAHPDVFNLLLQILDNGIITDANGREINFRNTIIVLTSNLGLEHYNKGGLGFNQNNQTDIPDKIMSELKDFFKPELLNRIDKISFFKPLSVKAIEKILNSQLAQLNNDLKAKNLKIQFSKALKNYIINKTLNSEAGARSVILEVEELIKPVLAEKILKNEIKPGKELLLDIKDNKILVK